MGQSWDFSSLKDRPYFSSLLDSNHLTRSSQLRFWPICGTPVEFPANPQSEFLAHCSVVSIPITSFGLCSILCACVSILSRSWVKSWSCMISRSCSQLPSWIVKRWDRSKIIVRSDWIRSIGWFHLSSELDFETGCMPQVYFNQLYWCPKLILSVSPPFSDLDKHYPAFLSLPFRFSLSLGLSLLSPQSWLDPLSAMIVCCCVPVCVILDPLSLVCCDRDWVLCFALLFSLNSDTCDTKLYFLCSHDLSQYYFFFFSFP